MEQDNFELQEKEDSNLNYHKKELKASSLHKNTKRSINNQRNKIQTNKITPQNIKSMTNYGILLFPSQKFNHNDDDFIMENRRNLYNLLLKQKSVNLKMYKINYLNRKNKGIIEGNLNIFDSSFKSGNLSVKGSKLLVRNRPSIYFNSTKTNHYHQSNKFANSNKKYFDFSRIQSQIDHKDDNNSLISNENNFTYYPNFSITSIKKKKFSQQRNYNLKSLLNKTTCNKESVGQPFDYNMLFLCRNKKKSIDEISRIGK